MIDEQVSEPVPAKPLRHEPLEDVHVGIAIALDQDWSIFDDADIPANHHAVRKGLVGTQREFLNGFPQR